MNKKERMNKYGEEMARTQNKNERDQEGLIEGLDEMNRRFIGVCGEATDRKKNLRIL